MLGRGCSARWAGVGQERQFNLQLLALSQVGLMSVLGLQRAFYAAKTALTRG